MFVTETCCRIFIAPNCNIPAQRENFRAQRRSRVEAGTMTRTEPQNRLQQAWASPLS
jgi:hypothetical protein